MDGHTHETFKPPVPLTLSDIGLEMTLMTGILLNIFSSRTYPILWISRELYPFQSRLHKN